MVFKKTDNFEFQFEMKLQMSSDLKLFFIFQHVWAFIYALFI